MDDFPLKDFWTRNRCFEFLHCSFNKPMIRGDLLARAVLPTMTDHTNPLILGPVFAPHILSLSSSSLV